jgi:SAM-dependent methyltransferase
VPQFYRLRFLLIALRNCVVLMLLALPAQAQVQQLQPWGWDDGTVPYVQTPMEIVERMLRMAQVGKGDHVIDLGSGDGRIVIEAAKRGATGMGVDLDPELVKLATDSARRAGVGDKVAFRQMDLYDADLSPATVVTMYLLPEFNAKLLPRLLELKPGTRIVSHDGGIGDWPPDEKLQMRVPEKPVGVGGLSTVELWIVPANAAGRWRSEIAQHGGRWQFDIKQTFQQLDIGASAQGRELLVRNSRLRGEEIKMALTGVVDGVAWHHYFVGQVQGDRIAGQVFVSNGNGRKTLPWTAQRTR